MAHCKPVHRDIFTWPPANAFVAGSKLNPKDIGFDLIEKDVQTEMLDMVKQAKEQGEDEPFCVFDLGCVVKQYQLWSREFPNIQPFYALKVYDDPVVIKLLAELGAGFDCASKGEIEMAQEVGVNPDNIVFANPVKLPSHISHAAKKGVSLMTFDSQEELLKIKKHYPKARLLLRIVPLTHDQVEVPFKTFGCGLDEVSDIINEAKKLSLSIVGVCFHIGSGCYDPMIYVKQITVAKKVFDLALKQGVRMSILDIGGGFFGTKDSEKILLKMSGPIRSALQKDFADVRVISEPGRFFVESGLAMATSVIGTHYETMGTESTIECVVSASAFGIPNRRTSMTCFGDHVYYPKVVLRKTDSKDTYTHNLRGPTVAPHDKIPCGKLPRLQLGDWLLFEEIGAYSVTASTAFNSFSKPPIRRVMERDVCESLQALIFFPQTEMEEMQIGSSVSLIRKTRL